MMINYFNILVGLASGVCLAIVFFGGLWFTTMRLHNSRSSTFLLVASFFGRIAVCVIGFYLVLTFFRPTGLLASFAGFIATQFLLVRYLAGRNRKR